jgi:hypothetical protein
VTDPKFGLVARKAGCSLPDVIAVWVFLLEKASAAEQRGHIGELDAEAIDCLFGFDDGTTAAILTHMGDRGLIGDGEVTAWHKRQPKREREGDNSTARVQALRQRQAEAGNADASHETPRNASDDQETPREEKSREEEKREEKRDKTRAVALPEGVSPAVFADWQALRKAKKAPTTATAIEGIRREADKAGISLEAAFAMSCERGWAGFKAEWVQDRGGGAGGVSKQAALEARNKAVADAFRGGI